MDFIVTLLGCEPVTRDRVYVSTLVMGLRIKQKDAMRVLSLLDDGTDAVFFSEAGDEVLRIAAVKAGK